ALSDFDFGGGAASGIPTLLGDASGDLNGTVMLIDSSFLNYFAQSFTPGAFLKFRLSLTNNIDLVGAPDQFSFSILDNTGFEIPTLGGPFFDVLAAIDISSDSPTVQTFAGDSTRTPAAGGGPILIPAPVVTVPEPSSFWVVLLIAIGSRSGLRVS